MDNSTRSAERLDHAVGEARLDGVEPGQIGGGAEPASIGPLVLTMMRRQVQISMLALYKVGPRINSRQGRVQPGVANVDGPLKMTIAIVLSPHRTLGGAGGHVDVRDAPADGTREAGQSVDIRSDLREEMRGIDDVPGELKRRHAGTAQNEKGANDPGSQFCSTLGGC
ncbi:hypothetical protein K469DRAFT_692219 [Zopfia rhizophila CBS 207.26]|uniref:Uncharacterized protein n=1 Tax=Zopfia rhizophila CBS 207.26 TaxID=1314779 RepID=A0A6A6DSL7_9PEZI|nr:hypothetical protein K469DRAFT_692219 [Zopfia rhizophila CBS 207.26]